MALGVAILVVAGTSGLAVGLMLVLRRRAPEGGRFTDSDRAAGVFSVLGTGLAVLIGFAIFLAFEDYGDAQRDAEQEAGATFQQFQDARLLGAPGRSAEIALGCYARSVVHVEWPAMRAGDGRSVQTEHWALALADLTPRLDVADQKAHAAFADWLQQATAREQGRHGRLLEARHPLPGLLWLMLILGSVLVVGFILLWADPKEPAGAQATLVGSVTGLLTVSLLLVSFLNSPYGTHRGSIHPGAMAQALGDMRVDLSAIDGGCDARGVRRTRIL